METLGQHLYCYPNKINGGTEETVFSPIAILFIPHKWHKFHTNMFSSRGDAEDTEAASLRSQLTAAPSAFSRMVHTSDSDVCFALSAPLRETSFIVLTSQASSYT